MSRIFTCLFLFLFPIYHAVAQQTSVELRQSEQLRKESLKKAESIRELQRNLFSLPYETDYISDTLVPETVEKRAELAPHYPDLLILERNQQVIDQAFADWVTHYPTEYTSYKNYLEQFISKHSSN